MSADQQPQRAIRDDLIDVLCRIEGEVALAGPMKGRILADSMADALLQGLSEAGIYLDREYAEEITPERRKRLLSVVARSLTVRREILALAAHATGHRRVSAAPGPCRECGKSWPCPDVQRAAGPALDAFSDAPSPSKAGGRDV